MSLFLSIPNTRWSKYYFHSMVIEEIYSTAAHTLFFFIILGRWTCGVAKETKGAIEGSNFGPLLCSQSEIDAITVC